MGGIGAPAFDQRGEIVRPRGFEIHFFTGGGMTETECACVQRLSRTDGHAVAHESRVIGTARSPQNLIAAVAFVGKQGMPDVFHVGTDLMGTAGLKHALHKGHIAEAFHHGVVSSGRFSDFTIGREDRHLQTVFGMARNVALNATALRLTISPNQGIIAATRGFLEELSTKMRFRLGRFRHDQETARVFVDAMLWGRWDRNRGCREDATQWH